MQRRACRIQRKTFTQDILRAPFFAQSPQYIGEVGTDRYRARLHTQRLFIQAYSFGDILLVQLKRGEHSQRFRSVRERHKGIAKFSLSVRPGSRLLDRQKVRHTRVGQGRFYANTANRVIQQPCAWHAQPQLRRQ